MPAIDIPPAASARRSGLPNALRLALVLSLPLIAAVACDGEGDDTDAETSGESPEEAKAALLACGLPQPCPTVSLDGECCGNPPAEITDAETCVYEALRDRSNAHLTLVYGHDPDEWANNYVDEDLFIWSDGAVTMSRATHVNGQEGSGLAAPREAVLKPAAYFSNCLVTADEAELAACRSAHNWYESTAALDAAACL